jgi:hypothetical protein
MQRPRPLIIDVVAVLNILWGSSTILSSLCGGLSILGMLLAANMGLFPPMPPGMPNTLMEQADLYQNRIPGFIPVMIVSLPVSIVMGLVLLFAGVGLFKVKPWARKWSVVWSVYCLISVPLSTIYTMTVVSPVQYAYTQDLNARMAKMGMGGMEQPNYASYTSIVTALILIGYAIAVVVLLYRPHVSEAFAGKWVPPWLRDQNDDEEEASGGKGESPEDSPTTATQGIRPALE